MLHKFYKAANSRLGTKCGNGSYQRTIGHTHIRGYHRGLHLFNVVVARNHLGKHILQCGMKWLL